MQLPGLKREIDQIAKDKGINRDLIVEALEEAMKQAARRKFGQEKELEARFNDELGEIELFEFKTVVGEVTDPESQITVAKAHELVPEDPNNELFLIEAWLDHQPKKHPQAQARLEALVLWEPRPEFLVEDTFALKDARERLAAESVEE